jgi:hypothetical protein
VSDYAEQMQRIGMGRNLVEDLAVHQLCLIQIALLVQLHSIIEKLQHFTLRFNATKDEG